MNDIPSKPKKGRKYEQVLEGARKVFMADGFEGASVDAIARKAGVSKATLYSYFADKRSLFTKVACAECRRQADHAVATIDLSAPVETVLRAAATELVEFILSDFAQSVYRVCVGEADRFPDLGREFYKSGPQTAQDILAPYLDLAVSRGELNISDTTFAAFQFSTLCKADIFDKRVFGVKNGFTKAETNRVIDGAVTMFLAQYGVKSA
ncbi:MAG: TetR/AcrR family transcriptional regulator [Paracoccaceae bacterium]